MMPAAKHFDPIVGIDIHLVQPPGPVPPIPIPHPHVGIIMDAVDYLPVLGSTVQINNVHRAQAGTEGKCLPKHFPIGGTFLKFPDSSSEMFMGSSTVMIDGEVQSYAGLPSMSCQCIGAPPFPRPKKKSQIKTLVLPTSVVIPIPAGPPVLIGGPPTPSLSQIAGRAMFAGLGKGLKKLGNSKLAAKAGDSFRKVRQKLFKNMDPGFFKCKVLRAEPVNITTGEVTVDQEDFTLPGRLPLEWTRHYGSQSNYLGSLGRGWESPADARLMLDEDGMVTFHDGGPGGTLFLSLPQGEAVQELRNGSRLNRVPDANPETTRLRVTTKTGLRWDFPDFPRGKRIVHVAEISDPHDNRWKFIRDQSGLLKIREFFGEVPGRTVKVDSVNGKIRKMTLEKSAEDIFSHLIHYTYEYNNQGQLEQVLDLCNSVIRFEYDHSNRLKKHTDRRGISFYYKYESTAETARCIDAWGDDDLYKYHFEYRSEFNEIQITDSLGHLSVIHTDNVGYPVRETDPFDRATHFVYDDVGRTTAVIDPAGNQTGYQYDEAGNLLTIIRPDGKRLSTEFNAQNLPKREIDPRGNAWSYDWDRLGNLRKMTSPRGGEWHYEYNDRGDLERTRSPNGDETTFGHDRLGFVNRVTHPDGRSIHRDHDMAGNVLQHTDEMGAVTKYRYDDRFRLWEITKPTNALVSCEYDGEDNLTKLTDVAGYSTEFTYTGLGEIQQQTNPDGSWVKYRYDTEEQLIALTCWQHDRPEMTYKLVRDRLGRVKQEIDYWGNTTTYDYDAAGDLVKIIDPTGGETIQEYNSLGWLIRRKFKDGEEETFEYDDDGNLTEITNRHATISRKFDEDGNLVEDTQNGVSVASEYDLAGSRLARTSSLGNKVQYKWDELANPIEVNLGGRALVESRFDPLGRLEEETLAGKLQRQFRWDQDHQLREQSTSLPEQMPIIHRSFRYDDMGNLIEQTDSRHTSVYGYDSMSRLELDQPDGTETWKFADVANELWWLTRSNSSKGHQESEPASPEYRLEQNGQDYIFDQTGNLIRRVGPCGTASFEWDGNNRLQRVINEQDQEITFGYDPLGRRMFKDVDGKRTCFSWDGDVLLSDQTDSVHPREYIFRPESFEPLAFVNGKVCFFENDQIGLPRELLSETGDVLWSASYSALGNLLDSTGSESNPIRFQGQYHDPETGLYYNRFRYFDPILGTFISQDPIGLAGGLNLHSYSPNVWGWIDPLGLSCKKPEKILEFGSYEEARNAALKLMGTIEESTRKKHIGRLFGGKGKVVGFSAKSGGKTKRFRLDWDKKKGPHINLDVKGGQGYALKFPGTESDVQSLLRQFQR